ncbi:MAG: glycosyltransferase family 2 protein [Candidatus Dormibacteria bacterium]
MSVLMTVRNGERYLQEALVSLLGQSVAPAEVVVVDDGSTDGTADVLASFGAAVRWSTQPPRGFAAGLNHALLQARCDVIGYIDADDLWPSESLASRLELLHGVDAGGGAVEQFVSPELDVATAATFRLDSGPTRAAVIGALLFHRSTLLRFGPLDESMRLGSSVQWIATARAAGLTVAWTDQVVLRRRLHTTNLSLLARDESREAMLAVVRAQQLRRRAQPQP